MVIYVIYFLADLLFFQHIQVNRLDFNAWKCWQTCHYIELSEYKLYMGHIHTLVLTRVWIAMLRLIIIRRSRRQSICFFISIPFTFNSPSSLKSNKYSLYFLNIYTCTNKVTNSCDLIRVRTVLRFNLYSFSVTYFSIDEHLF